MSCVYCVSILIFLVVWVRRAIRMALRVSCRYPHNRTTQHYSLSLSLPAPCLPLTLPPLPLPTPTLRGITWLVYMTPRKQSSQRSSLSRPHPVTTHRWGNPGPLPGDLRHASPRRAGGRAPARIPLRHAVFSLSTVATVKIVMMMISKLIHMTVTAK